MSSVNITVLDQSPTWLFEPDREGLAASSWQSSWTGSPDSSYDSTHTQTNIATGTSSHVTSLAGATAQIDFTGSAISIYGQGTAGAYSTTLDGGAPVTGSPVGSMLATYGGLDDTPKHTLVLTATKSQTLSLSYATFTIRSNLAANSVDNSTEIAVTNGTNNALTTNSFFSTSGDGFSNAHSDQGYTRIDSNSPGALISFSCSKTSALFVYGTTNWNHQTFSVELDPPAGASQGARIFNGTSKWFVLDNLLFWEGGMDPTQTYQVKITNLIGGSYTDVHSVVTMNLPKIAAQSGGSASGSHPLTTSSGSPSPSTSATPAQASSGVGKTVAIAVGAVVAIAAVILLLFFCLRRRATQRRNKTRMTIDGMVTPFSDPLPAKGISLSHFQSPATPHGGYPSSSYGQYPHSSYGAPNSSYGDDPNNSYGENATNNLGAHPGNFGSHATTSAANSVRGDSVVGSRPHGPHYSELSGSEDFNPYSDRTSLAYARESSYMGSTVGSSSRPQSSGPTQAVLPSSSTTHVGQQQIVRKPEKGPIPSDTASTRVVRQEVDAGRVPDEEEETLPPSYGAWST
ncbi:hypothetical protein B0H19DRAFT_1269872 [Mycena capillaripes]|nr:hypothetical protein B0H19DRAFT_1269872 [Mycena capillaripes]